MIEVTDLTCLREGKPWLDGADFRLYNGMTYGITGTGAEDLLAVLAGSLGYAGGQVNLNGFDLREEPARARRGGGYVPANPTFCGEESAAELLSEVAALRGVPERQRTRSVNAMLEAAELDDCADRAAGLLSLPQKCRLWLAQALIGDTDRLLLAEPACGLEPDDAKDFWNLLRSLRGERTLLIATTDKEFLATCDALICIRDGKVTVEACHASEKTELALSVRGERNAIFAALSRVPGIESCRPGVPNEAGDLPLTLTFAPDADSQTLTEQLCAELESDGLPVLSLGSDGEEKG